MSNALHALSHILGTNLSYVVVAIDDKSNVWVGFKCIKCKSIDHKFIVCREVPPDEAFS